MLLRRYITIIVLIFMVQISTSTFLSDKGSGISNQQETSILQWVKDSFQKYKYNYYEGGLYLKSKLEEAYQQVWVVEIISGNQLRIGRSGFRYQNDQWMMHDAYPVVYWFWVPQTNAITHLNYMQPIQLISLQNDIFGQSVQNGAGISDNQLKAIVSILRNAQLSKKDYVQQNAEIIEAKLEDSYGSNWIVEVYSGYFYEWERIGYQFKTDQWVLCDQFGAYKLQYMIWVPGY